VPSTVLIVAKAPAPGRVKTRLVPPLTTEQAARVQEALLLDTLDACRAEVQETALLYADPDDAHALGRLAGPSTRLLLQEGQEGRGLADALRMGMARHLGEGPVALVSSDIPGVPDGALRRAFALLEADADVVLGPALDGGYWLIAMRDFSDAPFRAIPWSTPAVLAVTRRRCEQAGLRVAETDRWRDVDTQVDLDFLLRERESLDAPRTVRLLDELAADGVVGAPPAFRLDSSQLVTGSPWRAVIEDRLLTEDGRYTGYTYLAVPRAAFIVPVTDAGELVLVRQYRHPVRDWTLEVPAGAVNDGESPLEAAERELSEEVGGSAREWRHLSTFYSCSAHVSMRSDAFLASGVALGPASHDLDEAIDIVRIPLHDALERARKGEFREGQTALALLLAAPFLGG
jgi:rSAM/selenodomain-associated transferase 1